MVVVTGINVEMGEIYTNNPWGVRGRQQFESFMSGFVGLDYRTIEGYNFGGIYVPQKRN